jgi:hypothetical protein
MLKFPNNTKVSVNGFDEIMAALFLEGKKATDETAKEIIKGLGKKKNFIPSSKKTHREYTFILLRECRVYIKKRTLKG